MKYWNLYYFEIIFNNFYLYYAFYIFNWAIDPFLDYNKIQANKEITPAKQMEILLLSIFLKLIVFLIELFNLDFWSIGRIIAMIPKAIRDIPNIKI